MSATVPPTPRTLRFRAFARELGDKHRSDLDTSFCWILGAGASIRSGIPAAGELAEGWFKRLHLDTFDREDGWEKWMREGCGLEGIPAGKPTRERFGQLYSAIYRARFRHQPRDGRHELERYIDAATPSYGYYVLAEILGGGGHDEYSRHNIVITPNFDNLVADTLSALGKRAPIVIGHSALADFARATRRRPLILKFHHDYLFNPLSDPGELARMQAGYGTALREIFTRYTPVVFGYGGNDPSLMDLLGAIPERAIPNGLYWCTRADSPPNKVVLEILHRQGGTHVEIPGFDEAFALLEKEFEVRFQPSDLRNRVETRVAQLDTARQELQTNLEKLFAASSTTQPGGSKTGDALAVLQAITPGSASRVESAPIALTRPWYEWEQLAAGIKDADERDRFYRDGIASTGEAPQLVGNYALFLRNVRRDFDGAETQFRRALELDPNNSLVLGFYADFLATVRQDADAGEMHYRRALEVNPDNGFVLGFYARFLEAVRTDFEAAATFYQRAVEADPSSAYNLHNYAKFLWKVRNDPEKAREYFQRWEAVGGARPEQLRGYADFLEQTGGDSKKATELRNRAGELEKRGNNGEATVLD